MKIFFVLSILFITSNVSSQTLHLYGGNNHDDYLGCLNCSNTDNSSIWNEFGLYGSSYSDTSIWNEYGKYGSEYNTYSPWNEYSNNSPVVVDKEGNFYGYFTINVYRDKRADFNLASTIYKYHEQIKDDVGDWYYKIFD